VNEIGKFTRLRKSFFFEYIFLIFLGAGLEYRFPPAFDSEAGRRVGFEALKPIFVLLFFKETFY
jgi:hypothetical protein